jgi:hypothetical protein
LRNAPRWANVGRKCSDDAPAFGIPDAARADLPSAADSAFSQNARWARLARSVPGGWAGYALEEGVPTIHLVDPSRRLEAVRAINQLGGVDGRKLGDDVRVRSARWSFAQLYDWSQLLTAKLDGAGIQSVGIDVTGNRIIYGVASADEGSKFENRLSSLDVPCFLVAVREEGQRTIGTGSR